jgi:hypothetical protein
MTEQDFFDIDTTLLNIKPNPANRYLQFFLSEHPLASQNGMVNFARHVASQKIGRWLTPNEVVVHSDGDRENCAPDNLLVFLRSELAKYCLPSHKVERVLLVCSRPECRREYDEVPSHASRRRYCLPECAQIASRKFHVSPLEMQQMVWEMPTTHIARAYGVSDQAIAKFCKKHQIQKPGRGYWAKLYAGAIDPCVAPAVRLSIPIDQFLQSV